MDSGSSSVSNICTYVNSIPMLNGSNFKKWKEFVTLYLGAMDLDYALWGDQPKGIKDSSSVEEKNVNDKWERSNRMSLMVIKCTIRESLRDTVAEEATEAKVLLQELEKRYYRSSTFVYMVLNSLPTQFNQFKVSYNCQRDPWSLNELIPHCVQEEERLKSEQCESAHLKRNSSC
ncbi:uncharacterized protein LOC144700488 [Wolffia australiana]